MVAPRHHQHPILLAGGPPPGLRGVSLAGGAVAVEPPVILRLLRQDFIPHFLSELASPEGRERLRASVVAPPSPGAPLRLEQPVHRGFNLVVVEASCRVPGLPRLDPTRIEGAGLVVRRRLDGSPLEGWMKRGGRVVGWRTLPAEATAAESVWDAEPERRRVRARGINGRLLPNLELPPDPLEDMAEEVTGLFPVPPELMRATGRTLLYGYVPVASSERGEEDAAPAAPFARADVETRMPLLLRPDRDVSKLPPVTDAVPVSAARPPNLPEEGGIRTLVDALNYLAQEAGLFTGEPYAEPLQELLAAVPVEGVPERLGDLFSYLQYAYARLLELRDPDFETGIAPAPTAMLLLPSVWPAIDAATFAALVDGVRAAMNARWARLAPGEGRFDAAGARYELRCFVRVTEPGCPPRPVWSPPSAPFTIKPWHESGEAPPVAVELPAPTLDNLKNLRPNVAFKVPVELQQFMDRMNLQGLLDGKAGKRVGVKFAMICGFNIPIITLCAFIVLQIFLVLLHIAFFWLPFVRICIPIPVPTVEEENEGGGG